MLRTVIAGTAHELDALAPVWRRLERHGTIFQSYEWNRLAARIFGKRESPCVVLVENDAGVALVPAAMNSGGLTLLGETLFDYRDALAEGDPEILRCAWAALAGLDRGLHFQGLRDHDARRWDWAELRWFCAAPRVLPSEIDGDGFAAHHIRSARLLRRLARMGVELRQYDGSAAALVQWIYQRKAEQVTGAHPNLFEDPSRVEFMVDVASTAAASCEIFTLESPGRIVAALVTFRDRGVRRFYTIYHDHAWARHSPGIALLYEVTRRSLAQGLDCDYLTGEQPHKTRFATSSVPLWRVAASAAAMHQVAAEMMPAAA